MTRRSIAIRDVTLRDGQQSLFATRMTQKQTDRLLPLFRYAGFYAMEVWGGAVPDSVMRYLDENPWTRLEKIKKGIGETSKLTALSRGRNLFGYNPYPEAVIEGFNRHAIESGIGIMRIFDALNDMENIRSTIDYVKKSGGIADAAISYTVDPKFSSRQRLKSLLQLKSLPHNIFTISYFVQKAKEAEAMGADMITIKDMAGLVPPVMAGKLISRLKKELSVPVNFHTHCTPGYGLASTLMAMIHGVDVVDTAIMNFAGGPAAPPFLLVQIFADKLGIDTGINLDAVDQINRELAVIREELKTHDASGTIPKPLDLVGYRPERTINRLFVKAIYMAKRDKENELLEACHEIERHFNFPPPDLAVKRAEIPGGMYTNMLAQLKQLNLDQHLGKVLELVPYVRLKSGCPPLVTPTSQIIGVQAVNCVIDESKGDPYFTTKSTQYINLVKGLYGKTPLPIDPDFREMITGDRTETPYNPEAYTPQENPVFMEYGNAPLAANEKELLLLELFPSVARDFLERKIDASYQEHVREIEEEKRKRNIEAREAWERMSPEEKEKRLLEGLYNKQ
jgi:pyruvate/oxaloacetate carboxyltransferase